MPQVDRLRSLVRLQRDSLANNGFMLPADSRRAALAGGISAFHAHRIAGVRRGRKFLASA